MSESANRSFLPLSLRRSWRFWFGSILSLAALVWLLATTDWSETWQALTSADYRLVLAALVVNLITIPIRSARWGLMFPKDSRPAFGRLTMSMLIGQAVNVFVPARLGDLVRATLIDTEHTAFVLGTQVFRIALDLAMLAALVVVLLFQAGLPSWWRGPGEAILVTTALALIVLSLMVAGRRHLTRLLNWMGSRWPLGRSRRFLDIGAQFVRSADAFGRPSLVFALLAITVLIWVLYATVNYILLGAVGAPYSWLAAVFLLAVLQLGVAVPSSPGRVGVYHYLAVQSLAIFGVDQATAVSYAILLHFISIILPAMIGALLAWHSGVGLRAMSSGIGSQDA
jgi:uncharacterized protein (TIRG00374 family)